MAKIDYTFYDPSASLSELQALYRAQLREATKRFRSAYSAQKELDLFRAVRDYLRPLKDINNRNALLARARHLREFLRDTMSTRRGYDDWAREQKQALSQFGFIIDWYSPRDKNKRKALRALNDSIRLFVYNSKIPSEERNMAIQIIYQQVMALDPSTMYTQVEVAPGIYRTQVRPDVSLDKIISDMVDEMEDRYDHSQAALASTPKGRRMP